MAVKIFCCYAHEDEPLLNKLKAHLKPLQRQRLIDVWHDRDIGAGAEWEQEIKDQLNAAQIILLLVSPDFMDSDYCYGIEMQQALERHDRGEVQIIPIILRPVYFEGTPFRKLQALPTDAKPVMSSSWQYQDEAYVNITIGIHKAVEKVFQTPLPSPLPTPHNEISKPEPTETPANVLLLQTGQTEPLVTPEDYSWHCIRTLRGHEHYVWNVTISSDGQTLASGSHDKTIKLWNLKTADLPRTLRGHEHYVWSVAISPDGQTLASGSADETVKLWNLKTGGLLHTFTGHEHSVYSVAISPDGQTLASGSADHSIKLWNLKTSDLLVTLTGHENPVYSVAISPDGQILASGSADETIKLWKQ